MTIYTPFSWTDEILAGAATYNISGTGPGQSIALDQTVSVAGSEITAARLNNIENGIIRLSILGARLGWLSVSSFKVYESDHFLAENGDVLQVESAITRSGLTTLTASTWYHIYAYLSGTNTLVEEVVTAPVAWKGSAYSKTGDTSRRYIGSFLINGSQEIIAFEHIGKRIAYKLFRASASPHRALPGGVSETAVAIDLSGIVPVTAKLATIRATNLADTEFYLSEDLNVGPTQNTIALSAGNTASQNGFSDIAIDSSQQIWYEMLPTLTAGAGYVDVLGYVFER